MKTKRILCLDFDGICCTRPKKREGYDILPDLPTEGLFEFLLEAYKVFDIVVYSTVKSRCPSSRTAMIQWFVRYGYTCACSYTESEICWYAPGSVEPLVALSFPAEEPTWCVMLLGEKFHCS